MFENVPGMLSLGNGKIFDKIIGQMQERGYRTNAKILLSAHYGATNQAISQFEISST
jgi:DNA (cytosine-5)-methyltransferase 1